MAISLMCTGLKPEQATDQLPRANPPLARLLALIPAILKAIKGILAAAVMRFRQVSAINTG